MSDSDYLKLKEKMFEEIKNNHSQFVELVYRQSNLEEPMSPIMKEKYERAKKICEDSYVIDLKPKKKIKSKAKK